MNVSLERINEDYLFEVSNSEGKSVLLDNKSKTHGEVQGISPMELLLMGIAGCSSIDIIAILTTVLGVTTSLGLGTIQISSGLSYVFSIPETFLNKIGK